MVSQAARWRTKLLSLSIFIVAKARASKTAMGSPSGTATTTTVTAEMRKSTIALTMSDAGGISTCCTTVIKKEIPDRSFNQRRDLKPRQTFFQKVFENEDDEHQDGRGETRLADVLREFFQLDLERGVLTLHLQLEKGLAIEGVGAHGDDEHTAISVSN